MHYRFLDMSTPTAVQCRLYTPEGMDVPYGLGAGKGIPPVAYVGACYEAFEHTFSGPLVFNDIAGRLVLGAAPQVDEVGDDRALRELEDAGDSTASLKYEGLDNGPPINFPLCLWAPWYLGSSSPSRALRERAGDKTPYRGILSYSGNTGCAIGGSKDEALLHAVNEWIERDALSLFLLRSVHDGGPMPRRVVISSLPIEIGDLLGRAEERFGQRVFLLNLTTDIGVPVIMAYLGEHAPLLGPAYGIGASLSAATAAERAVTELVQGELLAKVVSRDAPRKQLQSNASWPNYDQLVGEHNIQEAVNARFRTHPRLLASSSMDFADRLFESEAMDLPVDKASSDLTVRAQRETAVARIAGAGHRVLSTTLKELPHGSTVVQVQCIGLERFHLVTKGHLALPGKRGIKARRSELKLSY